MQWTSLTHSTTGVLVVERVRDVRTVTWSETPSCLLLDGSSERDLGYNGSAKCTVKPGACRPVGIESEQSS
jgi:hypothetical protein